LAKEAFAAASKLHVRSSSAPRAAGGGASPRPLLARRPLGEGDNQEQKADEYASAAGSSTSRDRRSASGSRATPVPVQRTASFEEDLLVEELLMATSVYASRPASAEGEEPPDEEEEAPEESADERRRKVRSSGTWDELQDGLALHLPSPAGSPAGSPTSSPVGSPVGSFDDDQHLFGGGSRSGSRGQARDSPTSISTRLLSHNHGSGSSGGSSGSSFGSSFGSGSGSSGGSGSGSSLGSSYSRGAVRTGLRVKTSSSSMLCLPEPHSPPSPSSPPPSRASCASPRESPAAASAHTGRKAESPRASRPPSQEDGAVKSAEELGAELASLRTQLSSFGSSAGL
jgi:hypothetical protein